MGLQNFIRTEKVAMVSGWRELDLPDTVMITQGYLLEMVVVRPRELKPHQLSMTRPRSLSQVWSGLVILIHVTRTVNTPMSFLMWLMPFTFTLLLLHSHVI